MKKISQLLKRLCAPFVRDLLQQFRDSSCSATQAAEQLQVSKRRLYQLFHSYLKAVGQRKAHQWSPRLSSGARRAAWPKTVQDLVVRLLKAKPPCSYSLVASECLRRLHHTVDRATVRRFALQATGLPLCLYVDFHSFFFSHLPGAHTQLADSLRFYGVSLRFAPTPQAKGKIERGHQFWQKRFPALLAADAITTLVEANPLLEVLRRHHNTMEQHREIRCTPQAAWDQAKKESRWALRPAPACPWWPYVFSQRTRIRVGDDGRVAVGTQRLSVDAPPRSKVIHCQHPNGDVTVLQQPPDPEKMPVVLLSTRLC